MAEPLPPASPSESPPKRKPAWPLGCLFSFGSVVLLWLFWGILGPALSGLVPRGRYSAVGLTFGPVVLLFAAEILGGIYLKRTGRERLGRALLFSVLFTVAAAVLVALALTACLMMMGDFH
jgi:hypothetical protein